MKQEFVDIEMQVVEDEQFYTPLYLDTLRYLEDKGVDYRMEGGQRPWFDGSMGYRGDSHTSEVKDCRIITLYFYGIPEKMMKEVILEQLRHMASKQQHVVKVYEGGATLYKVELHPNNVPMWGIKRIGDYK